MAAAAPTIPCKQCNYENEPERVYCHNCGAKLDRTLLPKETDNKPKESLEKTRRRVKRLTTPATGFFLHWYKLLPEVILLAVVTAGAIQAIRPPLGVPPVPTNDQLLDAQPLAEQIEEQQAAATPRQFTITAPAANLYLAKTIRPGGNKDDYARFERVFVSMAPDVCRVTAQESAFGHPVYAGASYALSISGNRLLATNVGGNIGRLPVHPLIMTYAGTALKNIWTALDKERKLMDGMESITVQKDQITFITRPGSDPH